MIGLLVSVIALWLAVGAAWLAWRTARHARELARQLAAWEATRSIRSTRTRPLS